MNPGYAPIIRAIASGTPVLTANKRLSRHLTSVYDAHMASNGLSGWPTPVIMPYSTWLEKLRAELDIDPEKTLLSQTRAQALWRRAAPIKVLKDAGLDPSSPGLSELAYDAYKLSKEYSIEPPKGYFATRETELLVSWIDSYEAFAARQGLIDPVTLTDAIVRRLLKAEAAMPEAIMLAGFEEMTPALTRLVETLVKNSVCIYRWPELSAKTEMSGKVEIAQFESMKDEAAAAARWARRNAATGVRIGFVVPELHVYRDVIIREFSSELDPTSVVPWERGLPVFNISLGKKLSDDPLVKSALDILSVHPGRNELRAISEIILSSYFSGPDDSIWLSQIDSELKNDLKLAASLQDLKQRCLKHNLPGLARRFDGWSRFLNELPSSMTPRQWAHAFSELLKNAGWLSHVKLSSEEFQSFGAWNEALESFATLDIPLNKISLNEALTELRAITSATLHQAETPDTGIEVLGMLEAAGQSFDKVWIMGCHEYALPREPSPNPFIPLAVQKEHALPRSTREGELKFASGLLFEALSSAPCAVISYPAVVEDRPTGPSPLLKDVRSTAFIGALDQSSRMSDAMIADANEATEKITDDSRIEFAEGELERMRGGTAILKNQSHCPFKAFAEHRLLAGRPAEPEYGLDSRLRGVILHKALKSLWDAIADSKNLRETACSGRLKMIIDQIVEETFASINTYGIPEAIVQIERRRLEKLLLNETELEIERKDFSVIKTEMTEKADIAGLLIDCKPDRLDRLKDGTQAILDYKSGVAKGNKNDWTTARPKDPQLIVYAMKFKASALCFVTLKPGQCGFVGTSMADEMLPGVKSFEKDDAYLEKFEGPSNWNELNKFWTETLTNLSLDFQSGNALVDPIPSRNASESVCTRCAYIPLCRITEREDVSSKEDNDDE